MTTRPPRVPVCRIAAAISTLADLSATEVSLQDSDLIGQVIFLLDQVIESRDAP